MKSNKLDSLPPDLRKEADKLLADKFKEPKKKTSFGQATARFAESLEKLKDAFEYPVEILGMDIDKSESVSMYEGVMFPRQTTKAIDPRLRDYIKQAEHAPDGTIVKISVSFKPVGSFPMDKYEIIRYADESMELIISNRSAIDHLKRVQYRLQELLATYGGRFYARCESVNYETNPYSEYAIGRW